MVGEDSAGEQDLPPAGGPGRRLGALGLDNDAPALPIGADDDDLLSICSTPLEAPGLGGGGPRSTRLRIKLLTLLEHPDVLLDAPAADLGLPGFLNPEQDRKAIQPV